MLTLEEPSLSFGTHGEGLLGYAGTCFKRDFPDAYPECICASDASVVLAIDQVKEMK